MKAGCLAVPCIYCIVLDSSFWKWRTFAKATPCLVSVLTAPQDRHAINTYEAAQVNKAQLCL